MQRLTKEHFAVLFAASTLAIAACSEARDDDDGTGGAGATTTMQGTGGSATTDTTTTTTTTGGMGGMSGGADYMGVVINEISVDGEDWVELYNTTSADVTFPAGFRLTDRNNDTMGPKVGMDFEGADLAGQTIAAGGYLVALQPEDDMGTPTFSCTDVPAGVPCVEFGMGLSQGNGDVVYLIDMADAVVLAEEVAAGAVGDGADETWGRFPNGTGDFAVRSAPTLGEANVQ